MAADIIVEGQQAIAIVEQLPLPTKVGQAFVIDDWDYKVTQNDLGFNYFAGNTGGTESIEGTTTVMLSGESNGSDGGSLDVSFDFSGQPQEVFAGYFASLFGLTDTLISLDGSGVQPPTTTPFPGSSFNTQDVFGDFLSFPDQRVEELRLDVRLESVEDVTLKIELRDENGFDVFTRRTITRMGNTWDWDTVSLALPADFDNSVQGNGNTAPFDWTQISVFALIVERRNVGAGISNPDSGRFLVDNLKLVDIDGVYPDLSEARNPADDTLLPQFEEAFLDYVRATSSLYFLDFASTDPRTGGIIQDRSTFADLMTVGGAGFQLSSYVIDAERGYLSRDAAAVRVRDVLRALHDQPQGSDRVGTIGYQGFFYHFLGIDGRRKQNFDFVATPEIDESLNTVELSTIDTALAIAGVVTVGQYFDGNTPVEDEIRQLSDNIYSRVDWNFLLYVNPDDPNDEQNHQFYLAWKPNETRDDDSEFGRFKIDDADGLGQYSSKDVQGVERPATIDFYTDEGLLIALLAMGSPNPEHRLGREVWDAMFRDSDGGSFVKTFPGSLFTYQFASAWLDTEALGTDNHPTMPVNFFDNTRDAIIATRNYAIENPNERVTLNENRWGLSAAEGPFDRYFAYAALPAALARDGGIIPGAGSKGLEGEDGTGDGTNMFRTNASGGRTVQLDDGETRIFSFVVDETKEFDVAVRYSNDNFDFLPIESVQISIDGMAVGSFQAQDTGGGGEGWNIFLSSGTVGTKELSPGNHELTLSVSGGDGGGVEIDKVILNVEPIALPLEDGTVTNYAVASSILHLPEESIAALWHTAQQLDMNNDGVAELLHPRFGYADAFNLEISDAAEAWAIDCSPSNILRCSGYWANFNGFSIDHGPMLIMIDNYLEDNFIPSLFMSHPGIDNALSQLFTRTPISDLNGNGFVDFEDLTILLANWNQNVGPELGNIVDPLITPVNFNDLTVLLADWTGPGPNAAPGAANGQLAVAAGSVGRDDVAAGSNDEREVAAGAVFNRLGRRDSSRDHGGRARRAELVSPLRRLQAVAVDRAMGERDEVTTRRDDRTTRRFIRDPARFLAGGR